MQLVDVPRGRTKRRLDLLDGARVEELAKLLDAHQLSEQIAVERERLRTPLLGRRVVLVHVRGDVVEEERRGEGRRRRRLDLDEVERALLDPVQDPVERGQVEDVLQALAIRLEHDRELRVPAGDLQQVLRLQALLPERRALAGTPARDEERARGVLAETGAVQRRLRELAEQEVLDLVRARERGRRAGAARRRPGSGARSRRPTTTTARRGRASRAGVRARPSPTAHARDRRRARGCRRASRRSRRGSARRRSSGRTGRRPSLPPARGGT